MLSILVDVQGVLGVSLAAAEMGSFFWVRRKCPDGNPKPQTRHRKPESQAPNPEPTNITTNLLFYVSKQEVMIINYAVCLDMQSSILLIYMYIHEMYHRIAPFQARRPHVPRATATLSQVLAWFSELPARGLGSIPKRPPKPQT